MFIVSSNSLQTEPVFVEKKSILSKFYNKFNFPLNKQSKYNYYCYWCFVKNMISGLFNATFLKSKKAYNLMIKIK